MTFTIVSKWEMDGETPQAAITAWREEHPRTEIEYVEEIVSVEDGCWAADTIREMAVWCGATSARLDKMAKAGFERVPHPSGGVYHFIRRLDPDEYAEPGSFRVTGRRKDAGIPGAK